MLALLEQFNKDRRLKILLLEDSEEDCFLIHRMLENLGMPYLVSRVENREEFIRGLQGSPDIILADYNLPSFNGLEALELKKSYCPDVPLLLVSGFLGEERAVDCLKKGATDFILKENLRRLNRSIVNALREAGVERKRAEAEAALRKSEAKYRQLLEQAADGIFISDESLHYIGVNARACEMLGYTDEEMMKMGLEDTIPSEAEFPAAALHEMAAGEYLHYESLRKRKDGSIFPVEVSVSKNSGGFYQGIMRDISIRKKTQHALEEALAKLEFHMANSPLAILEVDKDMHIKRWSGQAAKLFGWKEQEAVGQGIQALKLFPDEDIVRIEEIFQKEFVEGVNQYVTGIRCCTKEGITLYCESYHSISFDEQGQLLSVLSLFHDVTIQKVEAEARREWRARERKRVAREIHEGIGQMLVASKFKIASIDPGRPEAAEGVSEAEGILEKAIDEVRRISMNMAPRSVEEFGIENAIRQLSQQIESTTGIKVSFFYTGYTNTAGKQVLSSIYRIVQEALNNVIRHAHASHAAIELKMNTDGVELKIEDNGIGFTADKADTGKTSGLRNIKERIGLMKGSFDIFSDKEQGTRIVVKLPLLGR